MRDVCFSYGKRSILSQLSFSAAPGECVVLAGPNGSGKSTVLSLLAGVLKPDSGTVTVEGRVGLVPQSAALFEDMTVEDNLRFFAGLAGGPVPDALPFGVDLFRNKRVSKLSGGMKKRVSIVCALLADPDVLLLDEPCASLDAQYRDALIRLVQERKQRGCTVIYVSHDPTEVVSFCDRVVFFGPTPAVYTREQMSDGSADDIVFCRKFLELFRKKERRNQDERV